MHPLKWERQFYAVYFNGGADKYMDNSRLALANRPAQT